MPRIWTQEQRDAQAARIRANKPWEKSTGPVTKAGKKRSSRNALKHGRGKTFVRNTRKMLRLNREFLQLAEIILRRP